MRAKKRVFFPFCKLPALICATAIISFLPSTAHSGGFAVQEQSSRGLGQAFAGATTGFGDGSSTYYNPAAMTLLDSDVAHLGGNLIIPHADFENEGATIAGALGGAAVTGGEGGNGGELGFVPNLYFVKGVPDSKLKFGFAMNSTFGLLTEYDNEWVGRYHAIRSDLLTINVNPSVAYEINEHISIGAGVSAMYAEAELTNAIDFGTIGLANLGPTTATAIGLTPQSADGMGRVTGDDWGVGYTLGALFKYGATRAGVHFRSKLDLTLEGRGDFDVPGNALPLTGTGAFLDTDARASVSLPETIGFDVTHDVNDRWDVSAGALWTNWKRIQELRVIYASPQPDTVTPLGWNPSWKFAVGTSYKSSDKLRFRGGLSYERTPIAGGEFRTPRIPDNDRFWVTTGVTYDLCENLFVDFSYAHLFVKDANSSVTSSTGDTLLGEYNLSTDIVALALTWKP